MIGLILQATGALVWGAIIWEGVQVWKPRVQDLHNQIQGQTQPAPQNQPQNQPEDPENQAGA